jgi:hypothetical protein
MNELETIADEIAQLLRAHPGFKKGDIPHTKITKLYMRYVAAEREKEPGKKLATIQRSFDEMCGKNTSWSLNYAAYSRLHPDLLDRLNVMEVGGFYLSTAIAMRLAAHPLQQQKEILRQAQELSGGKQSNVCALVYRICEERKRQREFPPPSKVAMAPTPSPTPAPAPSSIAIATVAQKISPKPVVIEQNLQTARDAAFLKALERVVHTRVRRPQESNSAVVRKAETEWTGPREVIIGGRRPSDS